MTEKKSTRGKKGSSLAGLIPINKGKVVRNLAADRLKNVFAARGGNIMKYGSLSFLLICILINNCNQKNQKTSIPVHESMNTIYDFEVSDIDGNPVKLEQYRGKIMLIVNVASKCGFTPQYTGLQQLYTQYQEQGLEILGFPANNFLRQEPGTDAEIKTFCSLNYNVTFPLFAKISVKGEDQAPLYRFLTEKTTNPEFSGDISWNFNKFLISRAGKIVARFGSRQKPESAEVIQAIEEALAAQ